MSGDRLANQQTPRSSIINTNTNDKPTVAEDHADGVKSVGMEARVRSTSSQGTMSGPSRNSSIDMDKMTRPKRKRINPRQLQSLLAIFAETDTPSYELRETVGAELGMSNREVQVWFQNRRAKERATRQKSQTSAQDEEEKAGKTGGSVAQPSFGPAQGGSSSGYPVSSPPQRILAFSGDLDYGRRRSLSTGNIGPVAPKSLPSWVKVEQTGQVEAAEQETVSNAGPMRPRIGRYHTYASYYAPVSAARAGSWTSRPPVGSRLSFQADSRPSTSAYLQSESSPSQPSSSYTFPARNSSETIPSSNISQLERIPSSETLADRRNTRLPPVKLLLDIADMASYGGMGHPDPLHSAQSCPPLSPFGSLSLYSPIYPRSGYSEGATSCYFDVKTPTQSTRISPQSESSASDRFAFGRREDSH